MATRDATATWQGTLREGSGSLKYGTYENPYSFASRFEDGAGTNPEELLGAAHAGCYAMALNNRLFQNGFEPKRVSATAKVHLTKGEAGFSISQIDLVVEAEIPGIDAAAFQEHATVAKDTCIVSQALKAVPMTLDAKLV
jgi:osmotically inducible protein OsmC